MGQKQYWLTSLLLGVCFLCSCSASSSPEPKYKLEREHDYKVSVYQDGKEVKNFQTPLVQRVNISNAMLSSLAKAPGDLPFNGVKEKDNRGKITGLRIHSGKSAQAAMALGLKEKDLVTAVGQKRIQQMEDFRLLAKELNATKTASLTLERDGKPHKILYYIP